MSVRSDRMLQLKSLSCGYGQMTAVQELTLNVPDGEITALLGANGAGKSSTIMCIAGHVAVKGGNIIYDTNEITHASPPAFRDHCNSSFYSCHR